MKICAFLCRENVISLNGNHCRLSLNVVLLTTIVRPAERRSRGAVTSRKLFLYRASRSKLPGRPGSQKPQQGSHSAPKRSSLRAIKLSPAGRPRAPRAIKSNQPRRQTQVRCTNSTPPARSECASPKLMSIFGQFRYGHICKQ